jgi:hypothetical protein
VQKSPSIREKERKFQIERRHSVSSFHSWTGHAQSISKICLIHMTYLLLPNPDLYTYTYKKSSVHKELKMAEPVVSIIDSRILDDNIMKSVILTAQAQNLHFNLPNFVYGS